ncbi:putative membrane protein [Aspergillus brunneoviolaceus CBS 621.78]|uniref:Tyrosine phosphatase-like protein n=1 Tax=Aspergillus brunneoviolaceus CBS 621.78 TaxID=1450534 RepID=A0ACD1FRQ9_9EURO|nr:tyrosine phosphatase-like protein [Aspergillus brunneoviolaceus CBS 621.78]RAH39656.1 tyrosine phosphatase-like protein [Aspergillus brunneoviolaceus CBS 621.78]
MSLKTSYLLIYNTINALLWTRILLTLLSSIVLLVPPETLYTTLEPWTRWTQTLASFEILHSALGLTRSPIFTTFTQIFARGVQVWAINYAFPEATTTTVAIYPAMVLAWSLADAIRYTYFAVLSVAGSSAVPRWLRWLRYSLFLGLYPIGIASEWWLMFRATLVTDSVAVKGIFVFFLGLYAPGSVMMYKYMVKQRRKVLSTAA